MTQPSVELQSLTVFFGAAFLAVIFFAVAFLAVVFLAGGFLAVVFFVAWEGKHHGIRLSRVGCL